MEIGMRSFFPFAFALLALPSRAQVPSPAEILGFTPGEDGRLAPWSKIVEVFDRIGEASDRVDILRAGTSTEGRDFLAVLVSSPANLGRRDEIRGIQRRLHDPRRLGAGEEEGAIRGGPAVVSLTTTIHSTEVAGSLMAMELVHGLATRDDPETREILEGTLLVLVPSVNPDGIDIVHDWYRDTLGTPWEGTSPPRLYHPYVGHDNNRDWFMLTQAETRIVSRLLYREFLPEIHYDVHQMGGRGARLFLPPFADPVNPNLDPILTMEMGLLGTRMALDLHAQGFTGIVQGVLYDNWWHGGNRNVPYRHNMIGILSEAASANLASPVFQRASELRGHGHDLPEYKAQANFPAPWPGGWWRIGDIVRYELAAARSLLGFAARERVAIKRNLVGMARRAIEAGRSEPPFAYVLGPEAPDRHALRTFVEAFLETGIEVHRARAPFVADGANRPEGTLVVLLAQPWRAHAKDLLERQRYPDLKETTGGRTIRPYDVTAWTLPLQMGLEVVEVAAPFEADLELLAGPPPLRGTFVGAGKAAYRVDGRANRALGAAARLHREGIGVLRLHEAAEGIGEAGDFVVRGGERIEARLRALVEEEGISVTALAGLPPESATRGVRAPRVGVYRGFTANMDEGWTRWVLDAFDWEYETVENPAIRRGKLRDSFDAIVLPSAPRNSIVEGRSEWEAPPAWRGGIGKEGIEALRAFVEEGGTLVCFDRASELPIQDFAIPVKIANRPPEPAEGEERSREGRFSAPGSILEARVDPLHPLGLGMPERAAVYSTDSLAFEVEEKEGVRVAAKFPEYDPLLSGWLEGGEDLKGKAALVEVRRGKGRIVLVGFRCQHRGQPHGTFKVLFNALLLSAEG
jgi:hypothetical protein